MNSRRVSDLAALARLTLGDEAVVLFAVPSREGAPALSGDLNAANVQVAKASVSNARGDLPAVIARGLLERVWPLLASGQIRPVIHATFPLSGADAAHRLMESSQHVGKIVLTMR